MKKIFKVLSLCAYSIILSIALSACANKSKIDRTSPCACYDIEIYQESLTNKENKG